MADINIATILKYRCPNDALHKICCVSTREANGPQAAVAMCIIAKKATASVPGSTLLGGGIDEERMDIDDEHRSSTMCHAEAHAHGDWGQKRQRILPVPAARVQVSALADLRYALLCATPTHAQGVAVRVVQPQSLLHNYIHIPFDGAQAHADPGHARAQHSMGRARHILYNNPEAHHDRIYKQILEEGRGPHSGARGARGGQGRCA